MRIGSHSGSEAGNKLQSGIIYASATLVNPELHRPETPRAPLPGGGAVQPAAIAEISDAGRAALVASQPPTPGNPGGAMLREMTTGADRDYRVYGPGDAHYGNARRSIGRAGELATTPGPKTVGDMTTTTSKRDAEVIVEKQSGSDRSPRAPRELGGNLRTMAHEATHVVQQTVAKATSQDVDGNGGLDRLGLQARGGSLQQVQKSRHDAMMAAIQNTR